MKDVRLSLVVTKLLWIPLRTSAPNLPNAPSHLWLGGLNLYLLTETPTPSIATGVEYFLYPSGPRLWSLLPEWSLFPWDPYARLRVSRGRVVPLSHWTSVPDP